VSEGRAMPVIEVPKLASGALMVLAGLGISSLVGIWPTWRLCGAQGLVSAAWAAGVNVIVFALSLGGIWVVARRSGLIAAGKVFMFTGLVRVALLVGIAFAVASLAGEQGAAFWLWACGLYVALVMAEALWLARGVSGRRARSSERREP